MTKNKKPKCKHKRMRYFWVIDLRGEMSLLSGCACRAVKQEIEVKRIGMEWWATINDKRTCVAKVMRMTF